MKNIKRLTIFLCGMLLLASCDDIDEVRTLPKDLSIADIVDLSELTYDELNKLAINSNYYDVSSYREDMRRNGGLIIKGAMSADGGRTYNEAYLWHAADKSKLPVNGADIWNGEAYSIYPFAEERGSLSFYLPCREMVTSHESSVFTCYLNLGLMLWDNEYPGFVDNCMPNGYYQYLFSEVKTYTKETPFILDCDIGGDNSIRAGFSVLSAYRVTGCGVCYSSTNQLPGMEDEVAHYDDVAAADNYQLYVDMDVPSRIAGTYYVRAFAASEKGVAYSPVWKVTIY